MASEPRKVAVVTGAGTGIGSHVAVGLSHKGYHVIAVGRRLDPLLETQKRAGEGQITPVSADVSSAKDREKIRDAVPKDTKGLLLLHNAGISGMLKIQTVTEEQWDRVYAVNVKAPLFLSQILVPYLSDGGRIMMVSSGRSRAATAYKSHYCSSKAALAMLTDCMQIELEELGISMGYMEPGWTDTPMVNDWIHKTYDDPKITHLAEQVKKLKAEGKLADPVEVGAYIVDKLVNKSAEEFSSTKWIFADSTRQVSATANGQ